MAAKLKTPEFKSEAEEAAWWDAHEGAVEALFTKAVEDGTLQRGAVAKRAKTPTTTIRLNREDIDLAKAQAAERGLRYQTYLKMIIHQALRKTA